MNKIIGLAIAAAFGLSACSNLDHKTAHEVMSISNDRILKEDHSFNITGSSRVYISPLAEAVLADEKVEEKAKNRGCQSESGGCGSLYGGHSRRR